MTDYSKKMKVSRAITVYVSGNICNLQCSYCYVKNSNPTEIAQPVRLSYPLEMIIKSFSPKRLGGLADITVIGSAETLLAREVVPFVHGLIHYGHVVTVVTNATLSKRITELLNCPAEDLKNLIVKASFHYRQLQEKKLMDVYFQNIKRVIAAGASAYPFVVISSDYLPELKTIGALISSELGVKAHCTPCNKVTNEYDIKFHAPFDPEPSEELVEEIDQYFDTRIFQECVRYKKVDVQNTFCYAGRFSLGVDFASGRLYKCHGFAEDDGVGFYEDPDRPYEWKEPIAMSCAIESCALQYNFFSEGMLPDYPGRYTYGQLLFQPGLISEHVRDCLDVRFDQIYQRLDEREENRITIKNKNIQIRRLEEELIGNPFKNPLIEQKVREGKKIAIYGHGNWYRKYRSTIDFNIACFLDSFARLDESFEDRPVIKPEAIVAEKDQYFVVVSVEKKELLYRHLEECGFSAEDYC